MSDSDAPECISIPESKSIELLRQKHERAARKLYVYNLLKVNSIYLFCM